MGRILLIEDDQAVRESLSEILKVEGHEVTTRNSARGVLPLVKKQPFEVIITDLKLGGEIDGIELIRKIRKTSLDSEVIIMTGYGTMESVIDALKLGVYDYVNKPFEPALMINTVHRALEKVELKRHKLEGEGTIRSLKDFNEEVLESSPEAIIVLNRDFICRYWNVAAEKLSGVDRSEIVGKDLIREKVWVLGRSFPKQFQEVLNGNVVEKIVTAISPRKRHFRLKQKLSPLLDSSGKVKGILVYLTDVTQSKTAEMKKDELRLQGDQDIRRVTCLYNIRKDSDTAISIGDFLDSSAGRITAALDGRDDVNVEIAFEGKMYGPDKVEELATVFAVEIDAGILGKGELRVFTDEISLAKGEKDLLMSVAELIGETMMRRETVERTANARHIASLGRLAGGLAHNLNNILGGILGYTSFMKSEIAEESPLQSYLRTIEESSYMAAEITGHLLQMSAGSKTAKHAMNVNKNIDKDIGLVRLFFDRNVVISSNLEPDLLEIEGDSSLIDRVLISICLNAREALQTGGCVSIKTSNVEIDEDTCGLKSGKYVLVDISDTGIGMDKDAIRNCFDPFFSTKGLGYGLGLSSAYGIVRAHGGDIRISSSKRKGTKLSIYLPAIGRSTNGAKSDTSSLKTNTVLIIDDEELIRKMALEGLTMLGYEVITANDATAALKMLNEKAGEIDAVVLDLIMPGRSYLEAYRDIRSADVDVPIILSSGYTLPADASRIIDEDGALFIQKPYKLQELSEVIQQMLGPGKTKKKEHGKRRKRDSHNK